MKRQVCEVNLRLALFDCGTGEAKFELYNYHSRRFVEIQFLVHILGISLISICFNFLDNI